MSSLTVADPASDIILNFIAGGVPGNMGGESGGRYDAVIGDAHSTIDLAQLDLAGIYALMANLLRNGEPSTAIGRYQFIRATLQSLAKAIPLSTKFTPELQDKLAIELMNTACRYQAWRTSKIDDATFLHLLSTQWASLPDPQKGGKSHYDGVGPNHASTTLKACYAMLSAAREALTLWPIPSPNAIKPPLLPDSARVSQPGPAPQLRKAAPAPVRKDSLHTDDSHDAAPDETAEELTREANPTVFNK